MAEASGLQRLPAKGEVKRDVPFAISDRAILSLPDGSPADKVEGA